VCDCKVGPGKFEGEPALTYLAWQAVLDGGGDESTGETGDLTDWLAGPFEWSEDYLATARDYGYCEACIRDAQAAGIAVWESDQGFVYSALFDTAAEYEAALAEAQHDDELAAEEEESDDELAAEEEDTPTDGSCGECGCGLPSWQADGSLCGRCEDATRRETTEAAIAAENEED
jgi:hypothetical protein